jgi:acyl carrier protein
MTDELTLQVAGLIEESSEGTITQNQALDATSSLGDKGFSSLSFLRLIDSIENELGVYVDLEQDTSFMTTIDGIVGYIRSQQGD